MKITSIVTIGLFLVINDWEIASKVGPEPRYINQIVYGNGGLLLFGGKNSSSDGFNDFWQWDGGVWKLLGTGATKRWDHSYVFMENLDQLLLFGGRTFQEVENKKIRIDLNDTWIYKDQSWKQLDITGPEERSSHAMAFDTKNGIAILYGGRNSNGILGDTWVFDGLEWERENANGPSPRYGHTMAYDKESDKAYLFGGFDGKNLLNDFWSFDGKEWTELKCDERPSARMAHSMQFDNQGKALLFGGWDDSNAVSGEMWVWQKNNWTKIEQKLTPQARLSGSLGFETSTNEFILFGGSSGFGEGFFTETWVLKN